ncbi:MAG: hypothetical protein M1827_001256 [Pycnora praestabilis]|nr:MAG: hypothetical protein M1827_001256 [Pycnora praestabilis]
MVDKRARFYNYPEPRIAPQTPYLKSDPSNPIVRGLSLTVGASVISSLNLVSNYLWSNAGFDSLRTLSELDNYEPRYAPIVIPISDEQNPPVYSYTSPEVSRPLPQDVTGRYYSVSDFHAAYTSGKLTPTAVAESLLPLVRRDTTPPGIHSVAFLQSRSDLVIKAAEASTLRYKEGKPLGLLDGVPVAVKDEVDLDGYKKTLGSARNFTRKEGGTSWCVKKWEEAGAVVLGKLNMHELGLDTTNNNPIAGTPLNPHNEHYYCGGSSGGSAYAVSAGLIPFALGADGGGSIRIPSNFCGLYGLKPSHGRVSGSPSIGLANTTGVIGPIASSMDDLEISYRVMAIPDPSNPSSAQFAPPRPSSGGKRKKVIGIYTEWFDRADASVLKPCREALTYYEQTLGYEIIDITIPFLTQGQTAHAMTILSEISSQPAISSNVSGLTAANKVLISVGSKTPATDFLQAQKLRNLLMQHLASLYTKYPGMLIVTPTTPVAGWHISGGKTDLKYGVSDANASLRNMTYVWIANFTGTPSLSVPVGYVDPVEGDGKIPVGLMAMGEWGDEDGLIEWGRDGEAYLNEAYKGGRVRPGGWIDVLALAKEGKTGVARESRL